MTESISWYFCKRKCSYGCFVSDLTHLSIACISTFSRELFFLRAYSVEIKGFSRTASPFPYITVKLIELKKNIASIRTTRRKLSKRYLMIECWQSRNLLTFEFRLVHTWKYFYYGKNWEHLSLFLNKTLCESYKRSVIALSLS